jgi:hypothetical protein
MKRVLLVGCAVTSLLIAPSMASAAPISLGLFEVAFNVDGTGYDSISGFQAHDLGPATGSPFNVSGFDFSTGLGIIRLTIGGAGVHTVAGFFDLELADSQNSAYDDQGEALGVPAAGLSWEIDEPGYAGYPAPQGDIYSNVFGGGLENANNLVAPDDVSMALAMNLVLGADEQAILTFLVSGADPGGFRLRQFDASGSEAFLSSGLRIARVEPPPIPEPGLLVLLGGGLAAVARRRRNTATH